MPALSSAPVLLVVDAIQTTTAAASTGTRNVALFDVSGAFRPEIDVSPAISKSFPIVYAVALFRG